MSIWRAAGAGVLASGVALGGVPEASGGPPVIVTASVTHSHDVSTLPLIGGWYDAAWQKRKLLTIAPGAVSADLAAFPALVVREADTDLVTARPDGRDILFTNSAGTKLPHELIDYAQLIEQEAGWVWFVRPSAVRHVGAQDRTYITYQKNDGAITIAQFDHGTDTWTAPFNLHAPGDTTNLYVQEDHGPASILVRASDSRLLTFSAGHAGPDLFMRVSTNPEDSTAWDGEVNLDSQLGMQGYSYPCPVQFADGTIWLIFRGRNSPVSTPTRWFYSQSTDDGATWSAATEFFTTDAYGYCHFVQSGDTLYFHGNANHPRFDSTNELYAWKYVKGTGWRTMANSSLTLPMTSGSLGGASAMVYNGAGTGGRSWIWDIAMGGDGHPRLLYSRCGDTANHIIHHARWTGSAWVDVAMVNSGGHIGSYNADDTNYQDDWYSGGACFNHSDVTEVFVSREVSGPPHEIWRYTTADNGATWTGSAITSGSKRRNFRPIVPRNASPDLKVVWRYGVQPDYTKHLTGIASYPSKPRISLMAARVATDISAAAGATLYMYWDNQTAAAQENRTGVWGASDRLVWHGRDAYSSSVAAVSDSTSYGNNGAKTNQNEPFETAGTGFRAMQFDGSDAIDFGSGVNMAGWTGMTVLAGVNYAGTPSADEHTVINNWSDTAAGLILRIDPADSHNVEAFVRVSGDVQIGGTATLPVSPGVPTLVGMTYSSAGGLSAIRNTDTQLLAAGAGALDADASAKLFAGRYSELFPATEYLTGSMEAVLVSSEVKSAAYIRAWHDTWKTPGAFVTMGATELLDGSPADIAGSVAGTAAYTITGTGAVSGTVGGAITGTAAGVAAYTISATGAVSGTVTDPAPATEPVTLAEAKTAARISGTSDFDSLIPGLISAARQMAEQETGRDLVRKVRRQTFDSWPDPGVVLPVNGAASVAISYWDGAAWTALDGAAFVFFELGTGTGIAPTIGTAWPALGAVAGGARVRVDITAGPADPTTADECVKVYIKALVAWWIDNPSAAAPGNVQPAPYLRNLLDPVRLWA